MATLRNLAVSLHDSPEQTNIAVNRSGAIHRRLPPPQPTPQPRPPATYITGKSTFPRP